MNQSSVTLVGTVGQEPEQRTTATGPVVNFPIAVTERVRHGDGWKDGATSWFQVDVWGDLGSNVVASVRKGQRVLVHGTLTVREYEGKDGSRGRAAQVRAMSIGHDLKFGTSRFERVEKGARPAPVPQAEQAPQRPDHSNEWAAPGTIDEPGLVEDEEPPF